MHDALREDLPNHLEGNDQVHRLLWLANLHLSAQYHIQLSRSQQCLQNGLSICFCSCVLSPPHFLKSVMCPVIHGPGEIQIKLVNYVPFSSIPHNSKKHCGREEIHVAFFTQFLFRCNSPCFFTNNFNHNFLLDLGWRLRRFDWSTSQNQLLKMQLTSIWIHRRDTLKCRLPRASQRRKKAGFTLWDNVSDFFFRPNFCLK